MVPSFRLPFCVGMSSCNTPGNLLAVTIPVPPPAAQPSPFPVGLGIPKAPPNPLRGGVGFGAIGSPSLQPVNLLASLSDLTRNHFRANGDFYAQASGVSVALHAAGYDYGGYWEISTGGTYTRKNDS